jgi:hypothetical protein
LTGVVHFHVEVIAERFPENVAEVMLDDADVVREMLQQDVAVQRLQVRDSSPQN